MSATGGADGEVDGAGGGGGDHHGGGGRGGADGAGRLFVCGTPIGNLEDATPRLVRTLGQVGAIACEDTRRTRQLLTALEVPAPRLVSYRQDNEAASAAGIVEMLRGGLEVALVTDAGMPTVSDPGVALVRAARAAGIEVLAIPGPSAVSAALAVSGFGGSGYTFVGFLPRSARELRELLLETSHHVVVAFESPARAAASLAVLADVQPDRGVAVSRELTKRFEHTRSGVARAIAQEVAEVPLRGEVVLVLDAMPHTEAVIDARALDLVHALVEEGTGMKSACRHVAGYAGLSSRELYAAALERRDKAGSDADADADAEPETDADAGELRQ